MKKLLLSAFALGLLANAHSQTILSETFDSGATATTTIPNWTSINGDGLTSNSTTLPDGFYIQSNQAGNQSWNSGSTAQSDDWLIYNGGTGGGLVIPNGSVGGTFLTWWGSSYEANYLEDYEVIVSTVGNTQANFTAGTVVETVTGELFGGATHSVDLSAYEGQTIYLAFHVNSTDKNIFTMDNVLVYQPLANDMRITGVTVDSNIDGDREFTITCENYGANAVTAFDVDWAFSGSANTTVNVTGQNLTTGQTYDVVVNVAGVAAGDAQMFNSEITTSDDDNTNNSLDQSFNISVPVPQFVGTDSEGNAYDLHAALASGQSVILDFMASWCGPCQSSTPELSEFIQNNGSGAGRVQAYAITTESTDTDAVINGLDWNGGFYHYPKFAYTAQNDVQYSHYATMNNSNGIPLFIMICPNISDPGHSEIVQMDSGFGAGMFAGTYQTKLNSCSTAYLGLEETEVAKETEVSIYPNPATTEANVSVVLAETSSVSINLVNALGQTVYTNNLGNVNGTQNIAINTADLEAGMYFVNVTVNGTVSTERISITK
mgnify:CR=1 FL=1